MKRVDVTVAAAGALTLLLSACSLAPPLKTPVIDAGSAYQEMGQWTRAQPGEPLPRDSWWMFYGSAQLDELQTRLMAGNPTLAAALADYEQARAYNDQARAGLFPTLGVGADVERERESAQCPAAGSDHADLLQ